jgi:hypothetical protein
MPGPEKNMTLMAEPKPLKGVEDNGPGSTLAAARDIIQSNYPNVDGQMIVRQVSKTADTTWYRVNWYKKGDFGMYIHHSRFLALRKTAQGVAVEDQTAQPRKPAHSLN